MNLEQYGCEESVEGKKAHPESRHSHQVRWGRRNQTRSEGSAESDDVGQSKEGEKVSLEFEDNGL